jgi:guanylate kinase
MIKKVLIVPYVYEGKKLKFFVGKGTHSGLWRFPTGHVGDKVEFSNESVTQGARRELGEELGIKNTKNFFFTGIRQTFKQSHKNIKRNGQVEESIFATDITGLKILLDKKEFSEYKILSLQEALKILHYNSHKKILLNTNKKVLNKKYPKIFLLVGPSGSGKGVIIKSLLSDKSISIAKAKTATTRPRRTTEIDERLFVTEKEFKRMDQDGKFIEKNLFGGYWYGSVKENVEQILENLTNVIIEIDLNGVKSFKKLFSNTVSIFINVNLEELKQRLSQRNTETIDAIEKRLDIARIEIQNSNICDFVVENKQGKLNITVEKIKKIIRKNDGKK